MKKVLSRAVITILEPLVQMLLRYGISHSEFAELSRRAYVNVAFRHFSIPNRKKSNSRVSVITGLSRKEVVRLSAIEADEPPETRGPRNRAQRVVNGWLQDPDFVGSDNKPRALSLQEGEHSFEELVKRYSGGITARAVLDELLRVGTVSKQDNKVVKLNHYGYLPEKSDAEMLNMLAVHVADLMNTGVFNIERDKTQPARFQRQVIYHDIPESMAMEFQNFSHEQLTTMIIEMNQWLATHKKALKADNEEPKFRLGVGAYFFKNTKEGK
jgi:hypothetical protein